MEFSPLYLLIVLFQSILGTILIISNHFETKRLKRKIEEYEEIIRKINELYR